ncbi:spore germination protein, partial [Priestia megaterium]
RIDIDSILESGYIEQLIEDQTFTPFPTIYNTERPDVVAGNLLEGRIAIFV